MILNTQKLPPYHHLCHQAQSLTSQAANKIPPQAVITLWIWLL